MSKAPQFLAGTVQFLKYDGSEIRRTSHNGLWFFAIVDVVQTLTESADPRQYIKKMRLRDRELGTNWGTICTPLPLKTKDGATRDVQCATVEGVLRIVQSITSPKAEPFKLWLARVGYERLEEQRDPSEALERLIGIYLAQGRTADWIRERIDGIVTRRELTDEWKNRGIKKHNHYSTLTRMLQRRSVGIGPKEHRELKGLRRSDLLRNHYTEIELLFSRLGEKSTTEITRTKDAQGYGQNRDAVKAGGLIAQTARLQLEAALGRPVASSDNFLAPHREALPTDP